MGEVYHRFPTIHTLHPIFWNILPIGYDCGALLGKEESGFIIEHSYELQTHTQMTETAQTIPTFWYLLAAALAVFVPAGLILLATANLPGERAWRTALAGMAAIGLSTFAYWAVGFALQFGGVGLAYAHPELRGLVWEWSPLSADWGVAWGAAGLSGWFLSGADVTALAYALFLAHLPWVMTAAALPLMALRGRAPTVATLILALALGGVIFPVAGNWVQGGGWLTALGRNLALGHGFVDFAGAGSVFLTSAAFGLAALSVWGGRRSEMVINSQELPPSYQPLLSVVGALLVLGGAIGWMWANPLQVSILDDLPILRGSANALLAASAGLVIPLIYTWFVAGSPDPTMSGRGLIAGAVAGLAVAPFVQPGVAFFIGFFAGATVPFTTYLLDGRLQLNDATGLVISAGAPAVIGLLCVGLFADGAAGAGWQGVGGENYRGVAGQGVSGLFVARIFQPDFPGQLQSQIIGVAALGLWGFLTGLLLCIPLALIFHGLLRRPEPTPAPPLMPATFAPRPPTGQPGTPFTRREGEYTPPGSRPPDPSS